LPVRPAPGLGRANRGWGVQRRPPVPTSSTERTRQRCAPDRSQSGKNAVQGISRQSVLPRFSRASV